MSAHRVRARRNLRLAQISALGLLGLAGLLSAMPAPKAVVPAPDVPKPESGPQAAGAARTMAYEHLLGIFDKARKQERIAPIDTPKVAVDDVTPPDDQALAAAANEPPDAWPQFRYVGSVISKRPVAFIADHDGKTRVVGQGEYIGECMLLGISAEKLILADCNDERREYLVSVRPEVQPADSAVNLGAATTSPSVDAAAAEASGTTKGFDNSSPQYFPTPAAAEAYEAEKARQAARMREIEDRRNAAAAAKNNSQPPNRPAPQPRPATPPTKGNTKDAK